MVYIYESIIHVLKLLRLTSDWQETYLLEAHCEKFDTNAAEPEANPVTAVLQADESGNQVRCQCWVVVPGSLLDHTEVVQCNLVVTRCPRVQTLFFSNATSNP